MSEYINHPDFASTSGFQSIEENYRHLTYFVYAAAKKYQQGRGSRLHGKKGAYIPCALTHEFEIKTVNTINGSLFTNALLWYVFSEVKLQNRMKDKRGRLYPSNCIYKLYQACWTSKEICPPRALIFKQLHKKFEDILSSPEHEWVRMVERIIIPLFLNDCETRATPCYNPETKTYAFENKQSIMAWLVNLVQAIFTPSKSDTMASVIYSHANTAIASWKRECLGESEPEVESNEAPEYKPDCSITLVYDPFIPSLQTMTLATGPCGVSFEEWSDKVKTEVLKDKYDKKDKLIRTMSMLTSELNALNDLIYYWETLIEVQQYLLTGVKASKAEDWTSS